MLAIAIYADQHGFPAPESVMHLEKRLGMTGGISGGTCSGSPRKISPDPESVIRLEGEE